MFAVYYVKDVCGLYHVLYIPPGAEHEIRNTGEDFLGILFINVPTGEGLKKLLSVQNKAKSP